MNLPDKSLFYSLPLTLLAFLLPRTADADCLGEIQANITVDMQSGNDQKVYLKDHQILHDIKPSYGSGGKPTYYLARDIGPIPAKKIKLLNCHPVAHYTQGLWDPGYNLVEDKSTKRQLIGKDSNTPGEYLKTENLTDSN